MGNWAWLADNEFIMGTTSLTLSLRLYEPNHDILHT